MKPVRSSRCRKPANAFLCTTERTSLRVSMQTADAVAEIRCHLTEWMLGHPDPAVRRDGLYLTTDRALRVVLATFARDYGITLPTQGDAA